MAGFIGRVEFGSKTGSQFPAGRSYHGVEGSPWTAGMSQGAVLAALATAPAEMSTPPPFFSRSPEEGPWSTATRSCWTKPGAKYPFSSQRPIKSWIFRICFGQLWKDAALRTSAGSVGSSFVAKVSSRLRYLAW